MFLISNTTFREQKHRSFPTPICRSRKPMPLEITTFRVAFVHTDYNLTYNLRESFYSSLRTIARIRFLRLSYACEQTKPLLVSIVTHSSQKYQTNPRTDYKYIIIIINMSSIFILLVYELILIYIVFINYNKGELRCLKYLNK